MTMSVKFTQLQSKEVICAQDGRRLGFISDVVVEVPGGCVAAIVVPGPCRYLGCLGRGDDYLIPWSAVTRIGPDVVLVDTAPESCRCRRKKEDCDCRDLC